MGRGRFARAPAGSAHCVRHLLRAGPVLSSEEGEAERAGGPAPCSGGLLMGWCGCLRHDTALQALSASELLPGIQDPAHASLSRVPAPGKGSVFPS